MPLIMWVRQEYEGWQPAEELDATRRQPERIYDIEDKLDDRPKVTQTDDTRIGGIGGIELPEALKVGVT
jgi:hypothetical protein